MKPGYRHLMGLITTASLIFVFGISVNASEYPTQPITLVIPYGAGGYTDLSARALAKAAEKFLGQTIICENRAGGGGTVGPSLVLSRPANGYTIGVITSSPIIAFHMGKLDFHPIADPSYIILWGGHLFGIVVRADSQWKTIQDFVAHAKQNPDKISYASSGVGTPAHLAMEELASIAGIKLVHVPYKSSAETSTALLGNHVDVVSDSSTWIPLVEAQKLRLLTIYGDQRCKRYPGIPTTKELFNIAPTAPMGVMGPKGMPRPIAQKLHEAFRKGMDDPNFKSLMAKYDMFTTYLNRENYEKFVMSENERILKLVQKLGLQKK